MARVRSPNYPSISLPEALQRMKVIHAAERHLAAPKDVIAKHLGYGGLNGASIKVISALGKYGLLEESGGDRLRVSPLAISILYPKDEKEKQGALRQAAYAPPLFAEIALEWEGGDPSDQNLRAYLVRRNFAEDAIDRVIQSYRETMNLLTPEPGEDDSPKIEGAATEPPAMETIESAQQTQSPMAIGGWLTEPLDDPYEIAISGNSKSGKKIEGRFSFRDQQSVDDLIGILNAMKAQLPKAPDQDKSPI